MFHPETTAMRNHTYSVSGLQATAFIILAAFLLGPGTSLAGGADQKVFPTPNAAMAALIAAVKAGARNKILAILGPELEAFDATRDKAQDAIDRLIFLEGSRILKLEKQGNDPNTVIAYLGKDEWPFPAPLVKTSTGWKFDGKAALEEIRDRQIGRNEFGGDSHLPGLRRRPNGVFLVRSEGRRLPAIRAKNQQHPRKIRRALLE